MQKQRGFEIINSEFKKNKCSVMWPIRKTKMSAGYDLLLPIDINLKPKEQKLVWLDIKAYMQPSEVLLIYIRSSMAIKYNLSLANHVAVIDADYYANPGNDGNIGICLRNNSKHTLSFSKGTAVAQGIFMNYLIADNCNSDIARVGGVGSTDE